MIAIIAIVAIVFAWCVTMLVIESRTKSVAAGEVASMKELADFPQILKSVPFDGRVKHATIQNVYAPTYYVLSHLNRKEFDAFCMLHGISLIPSDLPPVSVRDLKAWGLNDAVYGFHCSGVFEMAEGESKSSPTWRLRIEYCETDGLISVRADTVRD